MKHHIAVKFLAILLCACSLLAALASGTGILLIAEAGLYGTDVESLRQDSLENSLRSLSHHIATRYAALNLSNCTDTFLDVYLEDYHPIQLAEDDSLWFYTVEDENGNILASDPNAADTKDAQKFEFYIKPYYPVVRDYYTSEEGTGGKVSVSDSFESYDDALSQYGHFVSQETFRHIDEYGTFHTYVLDIYTGPMYLITLYLLPGAYSFDDHWTWKLAQLGYTYRYHLLWLLGASVLLCAVFFVYLCCAAGKKPRSQDVQPGGLNRLPLDLYGICVVSAVGMLAVGGYELLRWTFDMSEPIWLLVLLVFVMAFVGCLLITGFLFACAAQLKMPGFYWVKHSLIYITLAWVFRLAAVVFSFVKKAILSLGSWLRKLLRRSFDILQRFVSLLPVTWQWLLAGLGMLLILIVTLNLRMGMPLLGIFLCVCMILYGAHCFGTLLESTKRMSKGDLETKVEDKLLTGSFRECAEHLNALADAATEAAQKQMRSERMKAELVTNVSHDIKTPLTSIINYVDLLQKAQTPEQAEEYLEVLNRQSQRMKKLIEDLMEMSKASTGNLSVNLTSVDAVEAVSQALGEFSEKLENAGLTPVFHTPKEPLMIRADGRLTWRVLSNLLSNAVKYAMPGTRLYVDVVRLDREVIISLKNISREPLNISTDELTERFVRGDASRNTEGSGLGLNIAKSLMDIQKGQLQLLVDGDLFKATMVFPMDS